MATLPVINTPIVITRVEVYVLGINGSAEQTRNVVAFEDLGEGDLGHGDLKHFDSVYCLAFFNRCRQPRVTF